MLSLTVLIFPTASVVIFGTTILDQASLLGVDVGVLVFMFGCRAVGGAIGALISGIILDKFVQYSNVIMTIIFISSIGSTQVNELPD